MGLKNATNLVLNAAALATDAVNEVVDTVWDEALSGHVTAGTPGVTQARLLTKTITFTGAAGFGLVGDVPIFTVTGEIEIIRLVPTCTVNLVGVGPISLGVTGKVAFFVADTVGTVIDAGELWVGTTPDLNALALPAGFKDVWCTDNILATVTVADITGGAIRFDLLWRPLSSDGAVV